MDYKKIIKSRKTRIAIMNLFNFVPDKTMISLQYKIKTGNKINWKKPKRFTEKLQVYKLTGVTPLMEKCVDKYEVRDYVSSCDFADNLVGLIGVYNNADEINWDCLPNKFVAKDTLGCGGNSVIICKNKEEFDKQYFYQKCREWIADNGKHPGREHAYDNKKHRVIIEDYLSADNEKIGLVDYKFFCFNGKAEYLYVISNRVLGKSAELGIYNMKYELLPYYILGKNKPTEKIELPSNFNEMIKMAEQLSKPFPEVRVDLYSVNGKVYFGEMTFFTASGYMRYQPDEFDYILGDNFLL